jgi:hypothetical protein
MKFQEKICCYFKMVKFILTCLRKVIFINFTLQFSYYLNNINRGIYNKRPLDKIPNCQHTTILVTSIKFKMSDMNMAIYKVIVDELSCHLYISMK